MRSNRKILIKMLTKNNFECASAENGFDAIEQYAKDLSIKIILMDIVMPEMDGLEATSKIRELEQTRGLSRIPIIAITGNALESQRQDALKAGVDDYLIKPVKKDMLMIKMHALLARPKEVQLPTTTPTLIPISLPDDSRRASSGQSNFWYSPPKQVPRAYSSPLSSASAPAQIISSLEMPPAPSSTRAQTSPVPSIQVQIKADTSLLPTPVPFCGQAFTPPILSDYSASLGELPKSASSASGSKSRTTYIGTFELKNQTIFEDRPYTAEELSTIRYSRAAKVLASLRQKDDLATPTPRSSRLGASIPTPPEIPIKEPDNITKCVPCQVRCTIL